MNWIRKKFIALRIECHWLVIGLLRKQLERTKHPGRRARLDRSIGIRRYRAAQLASLYEVFAGIRDPRPNLIRGGVS